MRVRLCIACGVLALVHTGKAEAQGKLAGAAGGVSHDRGYGVGTLASGDKYFIEFKGTTTLKGQDPVSSDCKWKFTGGTGKVKGISGKGKCKGTFSPDGTSSWDIEGEYKTQ